VTNANFGSISATSWRDGLYYIY